MSSNGMISVQSIAGKENALILDVRTPVEYEERHIEGSELLPLDELRPLTVTDLADGRPIYLLCLSGGRAIRANEKLKRAGVEAVVIDGGIDAWEAAGLPVVRGRKTISLERQVRIAAGLLVLSGTVLGLTVHPAFFGLSIFVGSGLVFAGITDWCGMGLLLARMPWNHRDNRDGNKPRSCSEFRC